MMRFEPQTIPAGTRREPVSSPDAVALREAIQNPGETLADLELKTATVLSNRQGLPLAYSGRFAVVFRLNGASGSWAVRCFTTPGTNGTGMNRGSRYRTIAAHLSQMGSLFVPYRYIERGIRVGAEWYPIVAMRWATGETLGKWVEKNLSQPDHLRQLCGTLSAALTRMEAVGIAHGDWQHDNLLIEDGGRKVTFVDYDGFYVPELAGQPAPETGHPNYQHPARTVNYYGAQQDRFACLVIQTALLALIYDPALWESYADGESLLFKRADLLAPDDSPLFAELRALVGRTQNTVFADTFARLVDACHAAPDAVLPPIIAATELPALAAEEWEVTNTAGNSQKWWLDEAEGVARTKTVGKRVFAYIERLSHPETLRKERKSIWYTRFMGLVIVALICFAGADTFSGFFRPTHFLSAWWIVVLPFQSYQSWHRREIWRELYKEINHLNTAIEARQYELQSNLLITPGQTFNVNDFVRKHLESVSIEQAVSAGMTSYRTLLRLQSAGVRNAYDLGNFDPHQARRNGVATVELNSINRWKQQLELDAAAEYRKRYVAPQMSGKNEQQLEHEIAAFEEERDLLQEELSQFPDTSFWAYTKKVFGVREKNKELPHP